MAVIDEHVKAVEDEMDEVVCRKEQVAGSRRKIRGCKTRRELDEERAVTERLMRFRTRRGASPGAGGGQGIP